MRVFMLAAGSVLATLPTVASEFSSGISCDKTAEQDLYVHPDLFAGEFGHYRVDGCDGVSPHLILAAGVEYTFHQTSVENWFHPLGFAYFPDGALVDANELEPAVVKDDTVDASCVATETCDHPRYFADANTYLGGPLGDGGFGLDEYEPTFASAIDVWQQAYTPVPEYNVRLTVNQTDTAEVFYFCHIHAGMSGRISICDLDGNGACTLRVAANPVELYSYTAPSEYDAECGTFGMEAYAGESGLCGDQRYLCTADGQTEDTVYGCFDAIDCAMALDMRVTYGGGGDEFPTFLRQMIPHHQNAVNMAKIMLTQPSCNVNSDTESDEEFEFLMRSVVNSQNAQIQYMRDYLDGSGEESVEEANCAEVRGAEAYMATVPAVDPASLLRDQACEILPTPGALYTDVNVTLDHYASEFGYFEFTVAAGGAITGGQQKCAGSAPNLVLAAGHEYRFHQNDITNWYHPMGFAYFPDGAIVDKDELEPTINPTPGANGDCDVTETCQSPMYYLGDNFMGGPGGDGGFGLDLYEPKFALSLDTWAEGDFDSLPDYNVRLNLTNPVTPEVFYFCHIHGGMSGRISVCDLSQDGSSCVVRDAATEAGGYLTDTPVFLAPHTVPDDFDQMCGSSGLSNYEPGAGYDDFCAGEVFLCTTPENYDSYAACYDAMDCAMHHEMKIEYTGNCQELFINSMIPHHQNAVNMAKTTLKYAGASLVTECLDENDEPIADSVCVDWEAQNLLREIIANQNAQIQYMRDYLGTIPGALSEPGFCFEPPVAPLTTTTTKVVSSAPGLSSATFTAVGFGLLSLVVSA